MNDNINLIKGHVNSEIDESLDSLIKSGTLTSIPAFGESHNQLSSRNLGMFETTKSDADDILQTKYHGAYCGVDYLIDSNGKPIFDSNNKNVVIEISPKLFNANSKSNSKQSLSPDWILSALSSDLEFEVFMANNCILGEFDDREQKNQVLIHIMTHKPPIKLLDSFDFSPTFILLIQYIYIVERICRGGLYREMHMVEDNLTGRIKGKINISKNISKNSIRGREDRFYCSFSSLNIDNKENQVVKAMLRIVVDNMTQNSNWNMPSKMTQTISYCMNHLKDVSDVQVEASDFDGLKLYGVYGNYNSAFDLGKVIIQNRQFDQNHKSKELQTITIYPFAINMQLLYELYVRSVFRKFINLYNVIENNKSEEDSLDSIIQARLVEYDKEFEFLREDLYIKGTLKPDIIIEYKNTKTNEERYFVYDVKYKNYENLYSARMDRLQLLAYVGHFQAIQAGLIFPKQPNDKSLFVAKPKEQKNIYYFPNKPLQTANKFIGAQLTAVAVGKVDDNEISSKNDIFKKLVDFGEW